MSISIQNLMILPSTTIHVTQKHLPKQLKVLVKDSINKFNKSKLQTASFEEQVGVISDYKFIYTNDNCGGYCNYQDKIIALNTDSSGNQKRKVILHEIGHSLQAKAEIFEKIDRDLLSHRLNIEHQVETIAYVFYNSVYPDKRSHTFFNSYFKKEDVIWLVDWYGNYVENDIKI